MSVQFVLEDGARKYAIVPIADYERLVEAEEMLADVQACDVAKARADEHLPLAVADRILGGESEVRIFREHRGLTQAELAEAAGISVPYLSQIERRRRRPSTAVLRRLAERLAVTIDDLT
jgi:DNA-binding XRE family transcriptional regulator